MIEPLGKHPECERLDMGNSLIPRCAVAKYAGKIRDLGNPATVGFEFEFDSETEAHGRTVARPASRCPTAACGRRRDRPSRAGRRRAPATPWRSLLDRDRQAPREVRVAREQLRQRRPVPPVPHLSAGVEDHDASAKRGADRWDNVFSLKAGDGGDPNDGSVSHEVAAASLAAKPLAAREANRQTTTRETLEPFVSLNSAPPPSPAQPAHTQPYQC
jgi:hypothetical protein